MKSYPLQCHQLLWILFLVVGAYTAGCKRKEVAERKPTDSLMVQFSQSPPVVENIRVKKLDEPDNQGNTVVLMVTFTNDETRLRGVNSIPLKLDDHTTVTVNDRGVHGDEKADDKIFTTAMKITPAELSEIVDKNKRVLEALKDSVTTFVGRVAETRRGLLKNVLSAQDAKMFEFEVFEFPKVTITTLPSIRDKSLMIRDLSVVEDKTRTYDPCLSSSNRGNPDGVWSFKTLITNMTAGGVTPKQFLIDWVDNFLFEEITLPSSGDVAPSRSTSAEKIIKAWMTNSGVPFTEPEDITPPNWQTSDLKAEAFPVRLLAIINRLDLRTNRAYGGVANSGEGRFVFAFADSNHGCFADGNSVGTMTFILEYGLPIGSCDSLVAYGTKWWELQSEPFGPAYNDKLEAITTVFTAKDASPGKPNGSALNHFRSNDFALSTPAATPWLIRDFQIDATTHTLKLIHAEHEPMEKSNGFFSTATPAKLAAMVTFANSLPFSTSNPNPSYTIPNSIKGIAAPMRVNFDDPYFWQGDRAHVITPLKRREFSFNTCSGCHKGETKTVFTHIRRRKPGEMSAFSGFMTGLGADDKPSDGLDTNPVGKFWVNDPGPSPLSQRGFNEALFRATKLEELVFGSACSKGRPRTQLENVERALRFRPLNMVH